MPVPPGEKLRHGTDTEGMLTREQVASQHRRGHPGSARHVRRDRSLRDAVSIVRDSYRDETCPAGRDKPGLKEGVRCSPSGNCASCSRTFPTTAPVTMTDREDEKFMLEDFTGSLAEDPYLSFAIPGVVCRE